MTTAYPNGAVQLRGRDKFGLSDDLFKITRALTQGLALNRYKGGSQPSFTDNSTGVAGVAFAGMAVPGAAFDASANSTADSATVGTRQSSTGSYAVGDTVTPNQDTGTEPVFTVTHLELSSASVATSGTGANATGVTFTGTTGTGTKFTVTGDISTNTLSNIAVVTRGDYTGNLTDITQEPITAVGYTGYKLSVLMGVKTVAKTSAGSVSVVHANPITTATSGSGTGCTLNVTWNAGVTKTAFDTAVTKFNNAMSVIMETFGGDLFVPIGLPAPTYGGTVAAADTIPAMDKTFTAVTPGSASTCIDYTTGVAAMVKMRNNMATCIRAMNMLFVSVGQLPYADPTGGSPSNSALPSPLSPPFGAPTNVQRDPTAALVIANAATTTSGTGSVAGATSISKPVLDTFFTNAANNVATLASVVNTLVTALNAGSLPLPIVTVD